MNRRDILKSATAAPLAAAMGGASAAAQGETYRRIATEEGFMIPEVFAEWRKVLDAGAADEPGLQYLDNFLYSNRNPFTELIISRQDDLGPDRIAYMDEVGVDVQLLALAAPGVQPLAADVAHEMAVLANDRLAEACRANPGRYYGMAAVAPHKPEDAAQELERAMTALDFKGLCINSHTKGEYLDDQKFWPILEAAEALGAPLYLHPRTPSPEMLEPYRPNGLAMVSWGFAAEAGLHAMRMITAGVFDQFPNLKVVLGHMGEGLPFWLPRMDGGSAGLRHLQKRPSDYFLENFVITTSGMHARAPLLLSLDVLGSPRIMFAIDYPFGYGQNEIAFIDELEISADDRHNIYHRTAEALFGI